MAIQKTFGIIKPDAVRKKVAGNIISKIEDSGLSVVAIKKLHLTKAQAQAFYAVHKEKGFYNELVDFMISGPVFVMVLEGNEAITAWRTLMGATNPSNAADGTLRKLFASSVQENAVHGSDAPETAAQEIKFFFADTDIISA
ncbi:MAG: nucleoside-diphosphate kinase [Fibrobacter sp.]|nr:nucleoside-diphosphate kinase [Fibrobacter sp.]